MKQDVFVTAALQPDSPAPRGMQGPDGGSLGRRFDVYRNNIVVGLTDALVVGFPVLHRLLGDTFFRAMAGVYVRNHPPHDPIMAKFGADMPRFLRGFEPVSKYPYLPDIARIELGMRYAYHAADSKPVTGLDVLTDLAPLRVALAPTVQSISSSFPIHSIWKVNSGEARAPITTEAESVLITRPEFDPQLDLISTAEHRLIVAMQAATPLGALMAGPDASALAPLLTRLIARKAIISLTPEAAL